MSRPSAIQELKEYAVSTIKDWIKYNPNEKIINGDEIHQHLFNEDYYIIGRYEATQWLQQAEGAFNCIEIVKQYEQDNFGEVSTDLSDPERVVNMYVYILGEEVLQMVDYNKSYNSEDLQELIAEIEEE